MKALDEMRLQNADEITAKRFADVMVHMLDDFIPHAARRDAHEHLYRAAVREKFELTTLAMRNEYLAWKQVNLNPLLSLEPK